MSRWIGLALCAFVLCPDLAVGQVPLGAEFRINSYTTGVQDEPRVAGDGAGNFVVVWKGYYQDGSLTGVFAQRYDASGAPSGGEFRVNTYTTGIQYHASVASDPAGNLVVVWASQGEDVAGTRIFARRFTAAGSPAGVPFRVNAEVTGAQSRPAVSTDAAGNFVVTWDSSVQDGSATGVFGRRFDAAAMPQGGDFRVNTYTTLSQRAAVPAMDADGDFVVVWVSYGQDGSSQGVFAQRFSSGGSVVGPEFRVNAHTTGGQTEATVAADPAGNFVVAWASAGQDGSGYGVFARRYDAAGLPLGGEFQVNVATLGPQAAPSVTVQASGAFTIAWQSGDALAVEAFARRYNVLGAPEGPEFRLNAQTAGQQYAPSVSASDDGAVFAAWVNSFQDDDFDVFGQRFVPDLIFTDDFEAGNLGAWSASATDGGDLAISTDAALGLSTAGLRGVVDDTAGLYVQDDSPTGEGRYRARFYFDPNGFDPGEALAHRRVRLLLAFAEPNRRVAAVVLRRLGGAYSVMARVRRDDNTQADTGFVPLSDGPHAIEIDLTRSSGPDANDGSLTLFVDGVAAGVASGLDNSLSDVDFARMGALSVKAGASGTMYWDQFVSRRLNYIGP